MLRQAEHAAHSLAQLSNALAQLLKAEPGSSHEPERSDASQPPVEPDSRVAAQIAERHVMLATNVCPPAVVGFAARCSSDSNKSKEDLCHHTPHVKQVLHVYAL